MELFEGVSKMDDGRGIFNIENIGINSDSFRKYWLGCGWGEDGRVFFGRLIMVLWFDFY